MKPLKIGNLTLDAPFFQAPLSGYSDLPMRVIARRFHCPLVLTGLLLDKMILHPAGIRQPICRLSDEEHPVGAQLVGNNPSTMASAAKILVQKGFDLIDLNFACPVPKVLRRERGGFLMQYPSRIIEIYQAVQLAVSCPVMMKIRTGFDESSFSRDMLYELLELAQKNNVQALVIHGRTVAQRYHDRADWNLLRKIKQQYPNLTIIGSGDLNSPHDVVNRLNESGLDGVIIARGAIGNPWIFPELRALFQNRPLPPPPTLAEQADVMLQHYDMAKQLYPPKKAVLHLRKFCIAFCKRHPHRKTVQYAFFKAATHKDLMEIFKTYYDVDSTRLILPVKNGNV